MKKNCYISLILALCLCVGLLAGCGDTGTSAAPADSASAVSAAEAPTQAPETPETPVEESASVQEVSVV